MKATRYRIVVSYDGTAFQGWQRQPDVVTVVSTLEKSFYSIFNHKISVVGASRTDAGVHAAGQVAAFTLPFFVSPENIKFAWNNILPDSLTIRDIRLVDLDFSPMHNVQSKTYVYHFFVSRPLPFVARYGWFISYPIDFEKLQACMKVFVGTHDFRSFCTGDDMPTTIKTIESIELDYCPTMQAYRLIFKGPGFLRYMIRRIAGACIMVATRKDLTPEYAQHILEQANPEHILCNAPAKGLLLYTIQYVGITQEVEDVAPFFLSKT